MCVRTNRHSNSIHRCLCYSPNRSPSTRAKLLLRNPRSVLHSNSHRGARRTLLRARVRSLRNLQSLQRNLQRSPRDGLLIHKHLQSNISSSSSSKSVQKRSLLRSQSLLHLLRLQHQQHQQCLSCLLRASSRVWSRSLCLLSARHQHPRPSYRSSGQRSLKSTRKSLHQRSRRHRARGSRLCVLVHNNSNSSSNKNNQQLWSFDRKT